MPAGAWRYPRCLISVLLLQSLGPHLSTTVEYGAALGIWLESGFGL